MSLVKFPNLEEVFHKIQARVLHQVQTEVVPMVKGMAAEIADQFIEGDPSGYKGTPQWSGNAAANWYITLGRPETRFIEHFTDVPGPGEDGYREAGVSPYSAQNPRAAAVQIAKNNIKAALTSMHRIEGPLYITNTAPYLVDYQPYSASGPKFRMQNHWPLAPARVVARLQGKQYSQEQIQRWKVRGKSGA